MTTLWSEKYRPFHLSEIHGHTRLRKLLETAAKNRCQGLPPLILYGPPGTGKTSIAHALALDTYPKVSPILSSLYLNASDERSIEVVRERIFDFVRTRWPGIERKFVIFDEVETMTEYRLLTIWRIEAPLARAKSVQFKFPQPARSGQRVATLSQVFFAYGNTQVYNGLDFEVERGERIVLVGPNGAGKSTLLKLLAGVLQPADGSLTWGHQVRIGYFSQYRADTLNLKHTVLQSAMDLPTRPGEQICRTLLGSFLFEGEAVFRRFD
jgi:SpoVK/Ycf46/Vps4 family AAA+-type ATPase